MLRLHYDSGFDSIPSAIGQPCQWAVSAGTADRAPRPPSAAALAWILATRCGNRTVDPVDPRIAEAVEALPLRGALFAYLHGSRASGTAREDSDVDIAAYFDADAPQAFEVLLPAGVDLVALNHAPLELAGRVALHGTLLFEHDPGARVVWEATTRKIYLDELPRLTRAHREFAEAVLRRGG